MLTQKIQIPNTDLHLNGFFKNYFDFTKLNCVNRQLLFNEISCMTQIKRSRDFDIQLELQLQSRCIRIFDFTIPFPSI